MRESYFAVLNNKQYYKYTYFNMFSFIVVSLLLLVKKHIGFTPTTLVIVDMLH